MRRPTFLLPANVAADVTGVKLLFKGVQLAWAGRKLVGVNRALGLGARFQGRNIQQIRGAGDNAIAFVQGSATVNFPLAATGDAVDGSVSLGSVAADLGWAFVPGSNTASAIGAVIDDC
jgi:hypothetical protein